jgi:hypothetical protein
MPKTVQSVKATMRDHTMSLPAPENTVRFGAPNACTECHEGQSPKWAVDAMAQWWPAGKRQKLVAQAEAFSAARQRRPEALDRLLAIVRDGSAGPLTRANAVGYLRHYTDARASTALMAAAGAVEPAIRVSAIAGLGERPAQDNGALKSVFHNALGDTHRTVRLAALRSLVNHGLLAAERREPAAAERLKRVSGEFAAWAQLHQDDAEAQHDLGLVQLLTGEIDLAATALWNSLTLDSRRTSTRYLLSLARVEQGRPEEARTLVKDVPRSDRYYEAVQDLLKSLTSP